MQCGHHRSADRAKFAIVSLQDLLVSPRYHERLRDHYASSETELWDWFADASLPSAEQGDTAELELLKSCYRLDGEAHDVLSSYATLLANRLGLQRPVVLYQELHSNERNARVLPLFDTIHIVFGGDLLDLLNGAEQQAVLAHEMAHVALWERDERSLWTLDHLMNRVEAEPLAHDSIRETARRLRLHTEVWADAVASELTGDMQAVVSAVVKVSSGIRTVDPEAYLRQARQIIEADGSSSQGWTHPELHVRVACLAARATDTADQIVAELIEGPDDLDRLDIFAQQRISNIATATLTRARNMTVKLGVGVAAVDNYLDSYGAHELEHSSEPHLLELSNAEPSVRYLVATLLLDVALANAAIATPPLELAHFAAESSAIGVGAEFDKVLARATKRSASEVRNLRGLVT